MTCSTSISSVCLSFSYLSICSRICLHCKIGPSVDLLMDHQSCPRDTRHLGQSECECVSVYVCDNVVTKKCKVSLSTAHPLDYLRILFSFFLSLPQYPPVSCSMRISNSSPNPIITSRWLQLLPQFKRHTAGHYRDGSGHSKEERQEWRCTIADCCCCCWHFSCWPYKWLLLR